MEAIFTVNEFKDMLGRALGSPIDLIVETLNGNNMTVAYLSTITDPVTVREYLNRLKTIPSQSPSRVVDDVKGALRGFESVEDMPGSRVVEWLLDGRFVIYPEGSSVALSYVVKSEPKRQPDKPMVERTIRGPHISFTESFLDNIGMIRHGIRSNSLRLETFRLGRETRTTIGVFFMENIADPGIVEEVRRRLKRIDIDGILDSGYVEQLISDNPCALFPLTQSTERPDKVVAGILEGRVGIVVDGSSHAIVVPVTINELYQSPEDYYINQWYGSFLRFFRILGNNIAVSLPGLYVALVGVNPELLPTRFTLTVAGSRMGVAIPLVIEVLMMDVIVEIFREASLRLPNTVSQTLGVTAGVVLGIAAVGAGLVSEATLVVVVITAIASFSGPNYSIGLAWRLLRYALVLAAALLGLYGLTLAGLAVLAHAAMQNSFGVGYLSPWGPFHPGDLDDTVIRRSIRKRKRPTTYHPSEEYRYEGGETDGEQ